MKPEIVIPGLEATLNEILTLSDIKNIMID